MRTITSRQMDALDTNCEQLGLIPLQLMENAGSAVSAEVINLPTRERVLVVAGRGNNGGDGFVAARHLIGYEVTVLLLGKSDEIKTPEAARNFSILKRTGIPVIEVTDVSGLKPEYFSKCEVIVDALFGTGIKGHIREPENTAIDLINDSKAKVVSVDVPSGMDPDGGQFEKAVYADVTTTFYLPKPGLIKVDNQEFVGEIAVADIGIPPEAETVVGVGDVKLVSGRGHDSHKGDGGRVLVIGGGAYSGAPALAAMAALRTGADIVTVAAPKSVSKIIASFSPNLIVRKLSEKRLHQK
ncbi:MAG: NAD(P)H-hydrate epimerase, partial [Methanosarcinales archaeon]|nr:NAD(P)H-hydrate epimerase [Methanosarcinales archaeon]